MVKEMVAMGGGDGDSDTNSLCSQNQKEKIFVSVRLRPINEKERIRNDVSDWECINRSTIIFKSTIPERSMFPSVYSFDRVFGSECSTKQVYEEGAKEVALAAVNGVNASVFAYGQTSSGKTYTMSGVTEYAVADIFDYIEKHPERQYVLRFSAIEIYNEAVRDLLSMDCTPLRLLDDPERGTVVERLTEETLMDWNHFLDLLAVCEAQRHIGETSLNEVSSRSHQIVRLTIESSSQELHGPETPRSLAACVNFVDLAGSERASQTMSAGTRLKEGCHINRSLLSLGTVIRKLSKGRTGHVPYRDSKLTRILQNSLGGNARTAIICTMSPARSYVEQSRNTLLFANCAKEVTTNAQVNVVMSDKALVKQLQKELARMERELRSIGSSSSRSSDPSSLLKEKELQIEKMSKEIKELHQQLDLSRSRTQDLQQPIGENSDKANLAVSRTENAAAKKFERLTSSLNFAENPEDNFLIDGLSPRLSICTPNSKHIVAADPIHVWNYPSVPTSDEHAGEDACKEVRCIEPEQTQNPLTSPEKGGGEMSDINGDGDVTYDSLRSKIHEMQKTIDSLVSIYPESEMSPSDSPDVMPKSRSSGSLFIETTPNETPEGSELGSPRKLNSFHKRNASAPVIKSDPTKDPCPVLFRPEVADVTCLSSINNDVVPKQSKVEGVQFKQVDEKKAKQKIDEDDRNETQEPNSATLEMVPESQPSSWEVEFKTSREKIIQLWHVCNVPLSHRSYFFLLFKGDPSDSVYLEVEQRRLSFLTRSMSGGSQSLALSSSFKTLNKEREMLSRRIHTKFSRRERLNLYQKWNIPLDSKQRSVQLARRLWTDTNDMAHIEESAELVGKLIGMFETNHVPKEMFGLSFSTPQIRHGRRSFSWTPTMLSFGIASRSSYMLQEM